MQSASTPNILVLQGGGALGAYQAGAYEKLAHYGKEINWVAGISIGAINAALIAGNPPEQRLERLHAFWDSVTLSATFYPPRQASGLLRPWWNDAVALWGACYGVSGFFRPRPWWDWWPQTPASIYDTAPLLDTLQKLVDFDYLNEGPMRFSVGSVDVESGNFVYFDNRCQRIGPEHVLASGALPPGFDAIKIGDRHYWDGGLVSNTPLAYVMNRLQADKNSAVSIFQIDLFSARGGLPNTLAEVAERKKDIRFSSRTRMVSDRVREQHQLHQRLCQLAEMLPASKRNTPEVQALLADCDDPSIELIHVIHHRKTYETQTKDYEFSRLSMQEHWQTGQADMQASLNLLNAQPELLSGEFRVVDYQAHSQRQVMTYRHSTTATPPSIQR